MRVLYSKMISFRISLCRMKYTSYKIYSLMCIFLAYMSAMDYRVPDMMRFVCYYRGNCFPPFFFLPIGTAKGQLVTSFWPAGFAPT